jgi:alpha-tubulin suppressor-like RCC1 family protein
VALATGAGTHSLFDAGGHVVACGEGAQGQLGNDATASHASPVRVVGLPRQRVTALTSSFEGSGALLAGGAYFDWGLNDNGQLGDGSTANRSVPIRVRLSARVQQVSQGGSNSLNGQTIVRLASGSVWMWGSGTGGQLGDGRSVNAPRPVRVRVPGGVRFVSVDSGGFSSYAIDRSGQLWAWGRNELGTLGRALATKTAVKPIRVGLRVWQVSSTASNVAGLR